MKCMENWSLHYTLLFSLDCRGLFSYLRSRPRVEDMHGGKLICVVIDPGIRMIKFLCFIYAPIFLVILERVV